MSRHRAEDHRSELRGDLCETPHPDRPGVLCDKHRPCFGYHANIAQMVNWPGVSVPNNRSRTVEMTRIANETARRQS